MKEKGHFLIMAGFAVLIGMALMAWSAERVSARDFEPGQGGVSMMSGFDEKGVNNYIYVIDPKALRLCVYTMKSDGKLHFVAGRNLSYDMEIPYDYISGGKYRSPKEIEKQLKPPNGKGKSGKSK